MQIEVMEPAVPCVFYC